MIPMEDAPQSLEPLTNDEQERREFLEGRLGGALDMAAEALNEISERRLYRNTHTTFAAYCDDLKRVKGWSREVKRQLVADTLKRHPEKSDRQIAAVAGAGHPLVARVRGELERSVEVEHCSTSTGADGKRYPRRRKEAVVIEVKRPAHGRKPLKITLNWDFTAVAKQIVGHYTAGELMMLIGRLNKEAGLE